MKPYKKVSLITYKDDFDRLNQETCSSRYFSGDPFTDTDLNPVTSICSIKGKGLIGKGFIMLVALTAASVFPHPNFALAKAEGANFAETDTMTNPQTSVLLARNNSDSRAFLKAAYDGDVQKLELILSQGTKVNEKVEGITALIVAAQRGHVQIVEALLKNNANANIKSPEGHTALTYAAENSHDGIVGALIRNGAKVNLNNKGWTPLMSAARFGRLRNAELLLENGADVKMTLNNGLTALMIAAENGHDRVVDALVKKGADIDTKMNMGWTALMFAAQNGHLSVVETLLSKGANANVRDTKYGGITALMAASVQGHVMIVKALLMNGVDVNVLP